MSAGGLFAAIRKICDRADDIPNFLAAVNEEKIEAWYAENASALAVEAEFIRQQGVPGSEIALVLAVAELVEEENHDLLRGLSLG